MKNFLWSHSLHSSLQRLENIVSIWILHFSFIFHFTKDLPQPAPTQTDMNAHIRSHAKATDASVFYYSLPVCLLGVHYFRNNTIMWKRISNIELQINSDDMKITAKLIFPSYSATDFIVILNKPVFQFSPRRDPSQMHEKHKFPTDWVMFIC